MSGLREGGVMRSRSSLANRIERREPWPLGGHSTNASAYVKTEPNSDPAFRQLLRMARRDHCWQCIAMVSGVRRRRSEPYSTFVPYCWSAF